MGADIIVNFQQPKAPEEFPRKFNYRVGGKQKSKQELETRKGTHGN